MVRVAVSNLVTDQFADHSFIDVRNLIEQVILREAWLRIGSSPPVAQVMSGGSFNFHPSELLHDLIKFDLDEKLFGAGQVHVPFHMVGCHNFVEAKEHRGGNRCQLQALLGMSNAMVHAF